MKKALRRGIFFLILAIIITYYGKFRPQKVKIVTEHGMIGWIFKPDSQLSALLVFPNDGNYTNNRATGERIFFNPLPSPVDLDSNFIRYNKKDLYLLGKVNENHLKNYCAEVDSASTLYYWSNEEWPGACPGAVRVTGPSPRTTRDWSVQSHFDVDSAAGSAAVHLTYRGQILVFSNKDSVTFNMDSVTLLVNMEPNARLTSSGGRLQISPGSAIKDNREDSSLALTGSRQALGFLMKESGEFLIKKLWMDRSLKQSENN